MRMSLGRHFELSACFHFKAILKMALSCMIGRISSPALKAQTIKNFCNLLVRPSSSVYFTRVAHYDKLTTSTYQPKELFDNKVCTHQSSLSALAKQFSTTSVKLSGHKSHDHSKLWTLERVLSFLLLPLIPAALISPNQVLDTSLALLVVLHTHFGLEAIVVDYVRPILFGNLIPKIGIGLLYVFSIATFAGLLNLIYNDMGLANAILTMFKRV